MDSVGQHSVRFDAPDIVRWTLVGEVTGDEAKALNTLNESLITKHKCHYLLIDLSRKVKISSDARAYWTKANSGGAAAQLQTVVFGGGYAMRAVGRLILSALMLVSRDKIRVAFAEDEKEALQTIDGARRKTS